MRFSGWYSLSILLIFATFVAVTGSIFVKGSNICLSCLFSKKAADCQKLSETGLASAKLVGISAAESAGRSNFFNQKNKQNAIKYLSLMADADDKKAELWQSIKLQHPKSRQIQSIYVEGYRSDAKAKRDYAKTLESQPGEVSTRTLVKNVLIPPNNVETFNKLKAAGEEMQKYCPDLKAVSSTPIRIKTLKF
jgi:hypothetical protein